MYVPQEFEEKGDELIDVSIEIEELVYYTSDEEDESEQLSKI
jgi:hypothetical protein